MDHALKIWKDLKMEMRPKIRYWLPAAAMDENDLRQEIRQLEERGFGGIEVVVLSTLSDDIARSRDGWGTENWDQMVAVIADETKKLGMSMDLAIGPGWPIASPEIRHADDPGALCELTYGVLEVKGGAAYRGRLPKRRRRHEEGTLVLVHVLAYQVKDKKVLCQDSYLDLDGFVSGSQGEEQLEYTFPKEGSTWAVFAFYRQPALHKINAGQHYVIDHLSREGARATEKYWETIFEKYSYDSMESFFCDSLEYNVSLDWTPDFPEEFETRRGYSILPYLPFIGIENIYPPCDVPGYQLENPEISEMVNLDYVETVTRCYCEYHLDSLEKMAERFGKTVRYQVAYNKPIEVERSALHVAIPENEALGRPSVDYQKTMAAAAHLGRKERYSFECAAEFGNSYGQSYEDLFWWIKRSMMAGMNAQVLHGGSYSGGYYGEKSVDGNIPGVKWPGFEAFDQFVSNYWNRTLSAEHARGCMDAVARMNVLFRRKAKVDCAVFRNHYHSEGMGGEFCLYPGGDVLNNRGYSYEFVSAELLKLPACKVSGGRLDKDGPAYKCLIIPEQAGISVEMLKKMRELADAGLPVIWIGSLPKRAVFYSEWNTADKRQLWAEELEKAEKAGNIYRLKTEREVPEFLMKIGILPDVVLDGGMDIMTAEHVDEDEALTCYMLYAYNRAEADPENPNPDEISVSAMYRKGTTKGSYERPGSISRRKVSVRLKGNGTVYECNPWDGKIRKRDFQAGPDGYMSGTVFLEEDEMILLALTKEKGVSQDRNPGFSGEGKESGSVRFDTLRLEEFVPEKEGETSFLRSGFVPYGGIQNSTGRESAGSPSASEVIKLDKLAPWRKLDARLEHFAGRGFYRGILEIPEKTEGKTYILHLGEVSDTFMIEINGKKVPFPDQVMKCADITEYIHPGKNEIQAEVVSNLYNAVFKAGMARTGDELSYVPRNYGIWESEYKKIFIEAVG